MTALLPTGLGIFTRTYVGPEYTWHVIPYERSNARAMVEKALQAGSEAWLFGGPSRFEPNTWRASLTTMVARARTWGATGVMIDAEGGWSGSSSAEARAMGQAVRRLTDSGLRVAFTSYPSWPKLAAFAEAAGTDVVYVIQIYGRSATGAAAFAGWLRSWVNVVGDRVVIAFAGWNSREEYAVPAQFAEYLESLPPASAYVAWTTTASGDIPPEKKQLALQLSTTVEALVSRAKSLAPVLLLCALGSAVAGFYASKGF